MADISSISNQKQNNISSSTKVKLESLGINISTVSSESEAQSLIDKLKAAKAGTQQQTAEKKESASSSTSEANTLAEAKSLASKMGLVLNNDTSIDEILSQISTKIRELSTSENPSERQMAQAYQAQLSTISSSYNSIQSSQQNMYSAMNMMSINNKYSLNL